MSRLRSVPAPAKPPRAARGARAGAARPARQEAQDITLVLRQRIATQEIPPGSKLRENELALQFGVARARVREALSVLEQRGLVERIPNRGAVVMRLALSQVAHLYDVREVLEGLCARLATQNGDPAVWRAALERFKGPMARHVAEGDIESYIEGYEAFRRQLIDGACNPVLAGMLDSILERTQALIRRIIILPGRAEVGLKQHTALLEAMVRGDADGAERLRRENMRSAKSYLERYQKYIL
ncbi:MAG: GntR family transcriptional regulator [Burkholderiales bacterium]|jgi:DNA-binding GntR family transcriptional regulator|nr:GntR family transcriptional regulator [Burkholderiales bacterium]